MTLVDLHSRTDHTHPEHATVHEARVLLKCRHPNILFMLGVALDYAQGPVLVMEQSWGSVMAALRSGPLRLEACAGIAAQVADVLRFLP